MISNKEYVLDERMEEEIIEDILHIHERTGPQKVTWYENYLRYDNFDVYSIIKENEGELWFLTGGIHSYVQPRENAGPK